MKGSVEELKLEELKCKVDILVFWEVLICVGLFKKRVRRGFFFDEEGGLKVMGGDYQKVDEVGKDKEMGIDGIFVGF